MMNGLSKYDSLLVFDGHTDIVRYLIQVDESKIVSAGDDGLIILWNYITGALLHRFKEHTRPITGLVKIDSMTIISCGRDRKLVVWNISTKKSVRIVEDLLSYNLLIKLSDGCRLASVGNGYLCLWSLNGDILHSIVTVDREHEVNSLVQIDPYRFVTAASSFLTVYGIVRIPDEENDDISVELIKRLPQQKETITCVSILLEHGFVSGTASGELTIWTSHLRSHVLIPAPHSEYKGEFHTYPFSIQSAHGYGQFVLVAMGASVVCVNIVNGSTLFEINNAHPCKIKDACFSDDGMFLMTSSEDGTCKLWITSKGSAVDCDSYHPETLLRNFLGLTYGELRQKFPRKTVPYHFQSLHAHTGAIQVTLLTTTDIFTAASDSQITRWSKLDEIICKKFVFCD